MVEDVLSSSSRDVGTSSSSSAIYAQIPSLKKVNYGHDVALVAFVCVGRHPQFVVVKPKVVDGQYKLTHLATIYSPEVRQSTQCVSTFGNVDI